RDECNADHETNISPALSRNRTLRDSPLRREQPQPVCKMPRRTENSRGIKRYCPGMPNHLRLHFAECRCRVRQNMYAAEAQMPGVPAHVEERDGPRPTLRSVHPVPHPGVSAHVALAASPNVKAVH